MTSLNIMWLLCRCSIVYGLHVWSCPALCLWVSSVLLAFLSPCLRKRELVIVLIVHLFVSYAHVNLCHVFSSSWCQGLAATSACGSSWTLVFTFFLIIMLDIMKNIVCILSSSNIYCEIVVNRTYRCYEILKCWNSAQEYFWTEEHTQNKSRYLSVYALKIL